MPTQLQPNQIKSLWVEVPPEVMAAVKVLQIWATDNHVKYWQVAGVCSRSYALEIQLCVPKLRQIPIVKKGTDVSLEAHNAAVRRLRGLVFEG